MKLNYNIVCSFYKIFEFCVVILFLNIANYITPLCHQYFLDRVPVRNLLNYQPRTSISPVPQKFLLACMFMHAGVKISTLLKDACIALLNYTFISKSTSVGTAYCLLLFFLFLYFGASSLEIFLANGATVF